MSHTRALFTRNMGVRNTLGSHVPDRGCVALIVNTAEVGLHGLRRGWVSELDSLGLVVLEAAQSHEATCIEDGS